MPPKWLPNAAGTNRRGLELSATGEITWAFCRVNDPRTVSIYLDKPKLSLHTTDPAIVEVKYGVGGGQGRYPVIVSPKAPGKATISAHEGITWADLEITVAAQRSVTVEFKRVKTPTWTAAYSAANARNLIDVANNLYRYQGNLFFSQVGALSTVDIPTAGAVVDRGGATGFESWECHVSSVADVTVFLVNDYENSSTAGGQTAGQWRTWMVYESRLVGELGGMIFAHEVGHFFGLNHPDPAILYNLMNQTSEGDRRRYKSYLTRAQIETVIDPANWDNKTLNVCSVVKSVNSALETMLKNFGH